MMFRVSSLVRRSLPLVAMFLVSVALVACSNVAHKPQPVSRLIEQAEARANKPYRIGVGDELEIRFFFAPELNDTVTVRPDGKISIMFAQDVLASGRTPEELADGLKGKLAGHVKQLDLVVVVRGFASQKAYIGGEVPRPGPVQLKGKENIVQVLNEAGWVMPTGKKDEILLIRREAGKEELYAINLKKIVTGEDITQNVMVQAGDQILVPPSNITSFDRWVDQYIRQALPFNSSFVVTNDYRNQ